jgi:signal transduction histidine kinase
MDVSTEDIVERLVNHRTLGVAPRAQLAWLAAHGTLDHIPAGQVLLRPGDQLPDLTIVFDGRIAIRVNRGAGWRKIMEWRGGDVTGTLPYSRMQSSPGISETEEPTDVLRIHRDHFPEMIVACHDVTSILVHVMVDRARHFNSEDFAAEKMMSLGRLAAGLAHELNNPASAVVRSAGRLSASLHDAEEAFSALGASHLPQAQLAAFERLNQRCLSSDPGPVLSALDQSDREDEFERWMSARGINSEAADALAEAPVTLNMLDELAGALDPAVLSAAVRALSAGCRVRRMALEIERAAGRIHGLVAAVKGFTYVGQSMVQQPLDLARGLNDTLVVISAKARKKGVQVTLDIEPGLPLVPALGGELNQVWLNLMDNAIDAVSTEGGVEVSARRSGDRVVVSVIDNGPGVPPELKARIFDPFFTTKPVGEGTGLGLDIARRLVARHDGTIDLDSRPGRTEFRVSLPLEPIGRLNDQAGHSGR